MKKYQWNSPELKKRANRYGWLMLIPPIVGLGIAFMKPEEAYSSIILAVCIVATLIPFVLYIRTQGEDKRLKPKE